MYKAFVIQYGVNNHACGVALEETAAILYCRENSGCSYREIDLHHMEGTTISLFAAPPGTEEKLSEVEVPGPVPKIARPKPEPKLPSPTLKTLEQNKVREFPAEVLIVLNGSEKVRYPFAKESDAHTYFIKVCGKNRVSEIPVKAAPGELFGKDELVPHRIELYAKVEGREILRRSMQMHFAKVEELTL